MRWDDLHDSIPYAKTSQGYSRHQFRRTPYEATGWCIRVSFPGDHEFDMPEPKGGDFAISVTAAMAGDKISDWADHRFRHTELWADVEAKVTADKSYTQEVYARALVAVVAEEADPEDLDVQSEGLPGLEPGVLLRASQVLAVCEWRRFWEHEPLGGRCLTTRFALGIIFGRWDSGMAASVWRQGKSGLRTLKVMRGVDAPTFREVLGRDPVAPHCPFATRPEISKAAVVET